MSLNQILENTVKRLDITVGDIDCENITGNSLINELSFKTQNGDIVNLSSLPDKGIGGYRLTSDGDGTVSWVEGSGSSGIDYNGTDPVALGKIAIYGATNGKLIKESTLSDTDILNKNGDTMLGNLDLNGNALFNLRTITGNGVDSVQILNGGDGVEMFVDKARIQSVNNLELSAGTNNVSVESNLDMNNNNINNVNNIQNVNNLYVDNVFGALGIINIQSDMDLNSQILKSNEIQINNIISYNGIDDILVNSNLDLNNNEIKNCLNITTTDINTTSISSISPATSVVLGANTDLDLNGNNIIGLDTINGIQPSGGVYSNPTSNTYNGATPETNILTGTEFGTKLIPANDFKAGSLFTLKIGGQFNATNNDVFNIRVVSNFGLASETEFVNIPITITDTNLTNSYYELEIDFGIRNIGIAGTASIITNGSFDYYNTNNLKKGTGINNVNNTTFSTEIDNILGITYSTVEASVDFTIDIATITKFY